MKQKVMAGILSVCMISGLAAGCGNSEPAQSTAGETSAASEVAGTEAAQNQSEFADDPAEIVVVYPTTYATPDLQMVEDAVNEITLDKINVMVDLQTFELGNYNDQINLMISSGEKLDAMPTFFFGSTEFTSMAAQKQLMPLDDLLEDYGQGILDTLPADYLETTRIEEEIVGVPVYKDNVNTTYFAMRTDILDKYGLTEQAQNIQSVDDMEAIFKVIEENEPNLVPVFVTKDTGILTWGGYMYDTIDNAMSYEPFWQEYIVGFDDAPENVQSVFHSEYYEKAVEKVHEWYEAGYVYKDSTTTELTNTTAIANNVAFSMVFSAEYGTVMDTVQNCGYDMTLVALSSQPITSQKIRQIDWVIPVTSTEPEAAMQFINLLYTDEQIVNLLDYGIEGVHYIKNEDGTISLPEGADPASMGYYGNMSFMIGNQYLSYVWDNYDPDTRQKSLEINNTARKSPNLGFTFDSSAYANEISAVTNVITEYSSSLVCGIADPATTLPEFREKLDNSGMSVLVDAVQEQLDAWVAQNK